jgi:hypothetical protein
MRRTAVRTAIMALLLALSACGSGHTTVPEPRTRSVPPSGTAAPTAAGALGSDAAPVRWRPRPGTGWQWQLTTPVDTTVDAAVFDIDGFENSAAVVSALHARGRKVVCYLNAGAYEDFRPDHARYPAALLGSGNGWPGEQWLDIRRLDQLAPLLSARMDLCRAKGFDAVEPDNLDGYANDSGFPLTAEDQLAFNAMVARLAHSRGLAVGLKNDLPQVPQLLGDFDFAVNEQCAEFHECDALTPFVAAGKAVFEAEYNPPASAFCADAVRLRFGALLKHRSLDAWREPC